MELHKYTYEESFDFEAGGSISRLEVAYHTSPGPINGRKVIWICHALTADSNPEDWWPDLVGSGKFIDPEKYYVVCVNMLGSCYGSSGPASTNPGTGKPYFFDFPKVTVRDIVRTLEKVREVLGIGQIDFMVGSSIGGFQAIEYAIMYPDRLRRAAFMATLARITPWITAFEESQRMALRADASFSACESLDGGREALKCARSIALLSYRNGDGYDRTQWEQDEDVIFADRAASYQRYQGEKLARRFDAYSYWYLSYSLDSNNAGRGRGGMARALGMIRAEVLAVGIDSDLIFPPAQIREMAALIPGAEYREITSHFGHDGFLLETEQIVELLTPVFEKL